MTQYYHQKGAILSIHFKHCVNKNIYYRTYITESWEPVLSPTGNNGVLSHWWQSNTCHCTDRPRSISYNTWIFLSGYYKLGFSIDGADLYAGFSSTHAEALLIKSRDNTCVILSHMTTATASQYNHSREFCQDIGCVN